MEFYGRCQARYSPPQVSSVSRSAASRQRSPSSEFDVALPATVNSARERRDLDAGGEAGASKALKCLEPVAGVPVPFEPGEACYL